MFNQKKEKQFKYAIKKKKGGGGAASFVIGAVFLGIGLISYPTLSFASETTEINQSSEIQSSLTNSVLKESNSEEKQNIDMSEDSSINNDLELDSKATVSGSENSFDETTNNLETTNLSEDSIEVQSESIIQNEDSTDNDAVQELEMNPHEDNGDDISVENQMTEATEENIKSNTQEVDKDATVLSDTPRDLVNLEDTSTDIENVTPQKIGKKDSTSLSEENLSSPASSILRRRTRSLDVQTGETFLEDWALPDNSNISGSLIIQTGITYVGVKTDDPTQLHLKMAYRAAATPAAIDWIYIRVDPELTKYIEEINIKNTVNIGAQVGYQRYFEKVDANTLSDVNTFGTPTGVSDAYAQVDQTTGGIYRVLLDKFFTRIPGVKPKERGALSGNWGVFPSVPLEAERYEANIYIKLSKDVAELQQELGRDKFGVQLRLQGQSSSGVATIAKESLNKNTIIDLSKQESIENNSNWLNSPSVHTITTTYEGKQMGSDGQFSNTLEGTDKSLIRVQNTIMNNLLYGTALDLGRPVSFNIEIDPQILNLVSDDDYITIWQVYRENSINHHDGGSNAPVMLKKNMFVDNKIKIEVNKDKAGQYENGVYYVNAVESFMNTVSSSPFVGANFIDIPVMPKPLIEDEGQLVSAEIKTWFTDKKNDQERVVRNSLASSYINLFPTTINFYDYSTKDTEQLLKLRESTYLVSTFGQEINGMDMGETYEISNYEFVTADPESLIITQKDGNVINLYYKKLSSDAEFYEPEVEKEEVNYGGTIDLTDNVTNLEELPEGTKVNDVTPEGVIDTTQPGEYEGTIEVTYPDGTKDTVKIPVEVVDNRSDAEKYTPEVEKEEVNYGGTIDLTDNVTNLEELPEGTKVNDVTPEGVIDTTQPGEYEGTIEVTYPDGTKDTVKIPVEVVDNRSDAEKYTPEVEKEEVNYGGTIDLTDNVTNLEELPEGTKVNDVTPEGVIDTTQPGEYEGTIEVTYPDGTKDTVKIPVEVVDNRSDAEKYTPEVEKEEVNYGGTIDLTDNVTNLEELPEGTKVNDVTPEGVIDTTQPGEYEGTIEVTYPDGTKDTVKIPVEVVDNRSDAEKYTPEVEKEEVNYGGTIDLTDNVTNLEELPEGTKVNDVTPEGVIDTTQPGEYEGTIEVTYPDGTKDTVKIPVEVVDNRSDAEKYTPEVEKEEVNYGGTIDLTDNVTNLEELPEGTKVNDVTPEGVIDTTQPGEYEGTIEVTYPDGTKDTVKIPVEVVDNRSDAEKYTPEVEKEEVNYGGTIDLTDNVTNLEELPEGTKVNDVTPEGVIDTTQPGEYEGTIEVTYPDGTKDTVKIPVEVVDNRSDAEKYTPEVEKEEVNYGGTIDLTDNVTNLEELPEGTKVNDVTPEGVIDTTQPGEYEGTIEVTYPDGTKDTVKIPVEVVDNRSDAEKYTPEVEKEEVNYGGTIDLTDNVTNLEELPEGTKVNDVTPEGVIDTTQPGEYEGTIEVTYPDGTKDTVKIPVEVVDNRSDAEKYTPEVEKEEVNYGGTIDLTDNVTNLEELPEGTKVNDVTPEGVIDTTQPGEYEGTIEVTYPDGTKDTVKIPVEVVDNRSDAEKYTPEVEKEEVNYGGTIDLTDNVTNLEELPEGTKVNDVTPEGVIDTTQPGEYEGTIEVTYPDGTKDTVKIPVEVVDNRSDAEKYTPEVEKEEVNYGGTIDLTDNVTNLEELPEGTKVNDVTPEGVIDTTQPGEYEGTIEVTYPDGTKDTVKIPVEVVDNRSDAEKYTPEVEKEEVNYGGTIDLTDNVTNLEELPEGTKVNDVTPEGVIDTTQPGEYEGTIEVTYPDGTKDTVKIPVEVVDNRSDAEKYTPEVEKEEVNYGGTIDLTDNVTNLEELPEGTKVNDVTPEGVIDTTQPGEYEGTIEVTYPDGTKDTVKIPVEVVDNRSDAEKYTPEVEKEEVNYGGTIDLTDNVTNLEELPEGTKVNDVTPEGVIDTTQPGEYEGTIEVTYPDGTKDTVKIPVEVVDNRSDAEKYTPEVEKEEVNYGGTIDLTDNVTNLEELPEGTKVNDVTPEGVIDTTQPGEYEGTIEVTYPDGTKDTVKIPVEVVDNRSDAEKYTPEVEKEEVNYGGTIDLTDNVTNLEELPEGTKVNDVTPEGVIDTTQPGEYEGTIEVTYPDGTKDTVKIPVEVVDNRSDAEKYTPEVEKEEVNYGGTIDLTDNVTNLEELPEGTKVNDVTPEGVIDTTQPGEYEGTIEVTYPDGTKDTVKIPVEVVDNRSDAEKYTPEVEKEEVNYGGTIDLTDNVTNLEELPEGTKVNDVTPEGVIDTTQPGEYEGTIEVTYPDGTKDTVKIPVEVVDNRSDAEKYTPEVEKEEVNYGGTIDLTDNVTNLEELPEGTKVNDVTPEGVIDTTQPGEYEGTIEVTYPDGTKDTVKIPVEVVDNRSDAEKYTPEVEKEEVNYGGTIDLTDNVTNLEELPEGTKVNDVTPEGVIDTTQPGEYEGTIEVTYPDGTKDTVKIPVEVVDNRSDAEKYTPEVEKEEVNYGGTIDLTDNVTNLEELPEGTKVNDVTPEGVIDTTQPGEYEGTIEVTFPDGSSVVVKIPIIVKNMDDMITNNQMTRVEKNSVVLDVINKSKSLSSSKIFGKSDNMYVETSNKELPKTGEENTTILSILGMLSISFCVLLFRLFKKREEN